MRAVSDGPSRRFNGGFEAGARAVALVVDLVDGIVHVKPTRASVAGNLQLLTAHRTPVVRPQRGSPITAPARKVQEGEGVVSRRFST